MNIMTFAINASRVRNQARKLESHIAPKVRMGGATPHLSSSANSTARPDHRVAVPYEELIQYLKQHGGK